MKYISQCIYITFGLIVIGFSIFSTQSAAIYASMIQNKQFGYWFVECDTSNTKNPICVLYTHINITKNDKKERIATYQFRYFDKNNLKMMQIVPLNVNLHAGTMIITSGAELITAKYSACDTNVCRAIADISDQNLATILSSGENVALAIILGINQVNLPIPTQGLQDGLMAIRKNKLSSLLNISR